MCFNPAAVTITASLPPSRKRTDVHTHTHSKRMEMCAYVCLLNMRAVVLDAFRMHSLLSRWVLAQWVQVWRKPVSFDTCLGGDDEDGMKMEDFVEDADAPSAEGEADELLVTKIVEDVLHTLNERERGVLLMRYGLNGMEPQTLEEVGAVYQVRLVE